MNKRKIISIVGTRPEIVKLPSINPHLDKYFYHEIINTNQHYDKNMSTNFFEELKIKKAKWNLKIDNSNPADQLGSIVSLSAQILQKEKASMVLVYGDTNTTLGGALTAAKFNIPVAHIEAGMRSYDISMPEELNRIICDHIATLLFCPSDYAVACLKKENITKNVYQTGDIHWEIFKKTIRNKQILKKLELSPKKYFFATIHRQNNTSNLKRLEKILLSLEQLNLPVIFLTHPRTKKCLRRLKLNLKNLKTIDPQNYAATLSLLENSKAILTDSGGVQKEAYWSQVPCISFRSTAEWIETVDLGWNHLVDVEEKLIIKYANTPIIPKSHPQLYVKENTSNKIAKIIKSFLDNS